MHKICNHPECKCRAFANDLCIKHYREWYRETTGQEFDIEGEELDSPIKQVMNGVAVCFSCRGIGCDMCDETGYLTAGTFEPIGPDKLAAIMDLKKIGLK